MKFALMSFDDSIPADAARSGTIEAEGGFWVRLGDRVFVCAADGKWDALRQRLAAPAGGKAGRKADLHLVVQTGRGFQNAWPDAPVLADKGRYLIVEFDRAAAQERGDSQSPRFVIRPLPENATIYADRPRSGAARMVEPAVAAAVAGVTRAGFQALVTHIAAYRTRLSTSADFRAAAEWARDRLQSLGLIAGTTGITVKGDSSLNVIATKPGFGAGRGAVLVVGHLDSVNHEAGAAAPAPGADDNGSGAAGVLALATAMAPYSFTHDLVFILFGGEEQGLFGSAQYVASLSDTERARIRAVLNMDMIGCVNSQPPTVMLEGAALSQSMIDALAAAAEAHTTLEIQTSLNPFASDHVPFIDAGIPAVLTIEGSDSANDAVHSARDRLERLDMDYATQILCMNAGWLAAEAGIAAQPGLPAGLPNGLPDGLPVPPATSNCDCAGFGVPPADAAAVAQLNEVNGHYQALFAQFARLHHEGRISPAERAEWQSALLAYGQLDRGPR